MSKVFFTEKKAEGGFFGLTLLFLVPWLLVTLFAADFAVLGMGGYMGAFMGVVLVGALLGVVFYIYGLFLAIRGMVSQDARLSACPGKPCACGVAALLLGAGLLFFLYKRALRVFKSGFFGGKPSEVIALPGFLESMLGSSWCLVFVALAVGLLAWGYLTLGKCYAERAHLAFSELWTKGVRVQWWTVAVIYVCSFALTGVEAARLASVRNRIENAVGRPMTAKAMEEYYNNGQEPDAEFWLQVVEANRARQEAIQDANRKNNGAQKLLVLGSELHAEVPATELARWRKVALDSPAARDFAACFDEALPPNGRAYADETLVAMELPVLGRLRELYCMEFWRAQLAAASRDFSTAQAALRRMKHASDRLAQDNFQICALVWVAGETMRCQALAEVIGAGLGDEAWLKALDAEMAALEERVDEVRLNSVIYGEALTMTDALDSAWNGKFVSGCVPMNVLKWVTPQTSWCLARDKAKLTRYLAAGLEGPLVMPRRHELGLSGIVAALYAAERKFSSARTNYRLVRALIAAALEKRRTGHWPSRLAGEVPEDPFAPGNSLQYQYGTLEVYRPVWNAQERHFNTEPRQVKGVRVYSVGANGQDDGGVSHRPAKADDQALWFALE